MILYINSRKSAIEAYDSSSRELVSSVSLTVSEINILTQLEKNIFEVKSRTFLVDSGWPNKKVGPNSLNVCIMHLRKKLKSFCPGFDILAVPSKGYKLIIPDDAKFITSEFREKNLIVNEPKLEDIKSSSNSISLTDYTPSLSHMKMIGSDKSKRKIIVKSRWLDLLSSALIILYSILLYFSIYH